MTWGQSALDALPPTPDLHAGTAIANAWALVTIAYSGIEQSLKYIIARQDNLTVNEWLGTDVGKKHWRHDLSKLYDVLDRDAQVILSEYYARFQSLHNYIETTTLRSFLLEVSQDGRGYQRWRYALVEESQNLPRNSADAMMAIWQASVYLIQHRQNENGVMMPDDELCDALTSYDPILRNRMEQGDHPLNACAQLLWEEYREIADSPELSAPLRKWAGDIEQQRNSSLFCFAARARGLTSSGSGIRWNEAAGRFEDVPWTLPLVQADERPPTAREIEVSDRHKARQYVLKFVYRHGFSVRERGHDWQRAEDEYRRCGAAKWQCTMVAEKRTTSAKVELQVWEHRFEPYIRVEIAGDPATVERTWNAIWPGE